MTRHPYLCFFNPLESNSKQIPNLAAENKPQTHTQRFLFNQVMFLAHGGGVGGGWLSVRYYANVSTRQPVLFCHDSQERSGREVALYAPPWMASLSATINSPRDVSVHGVRRARAGDIIRVCLFPTHTRRSKLRTLTCRKASGGRLTFSFCGAPTVVGKIEKHLTQP